MVQNSYSCARAVRQLGKVLQGKLKSKQFMASLPGAPEGKYVVIQFDTSFENKKAAIEMITPMLDKDGKWRLGVLHQVKSGCVFGHHFETSSRAFMIFCSVISLKPTIWIFFFVSLLAATTVGVDFTPNDLAVSSQYFNPFVTIMNERGL